MASTMERQSACFTKDGMKLGRLIGVVGKIVSLAVDFWFLELSSVGSTKGYMEM